MAFDLIGVQNAIIQTLNENILTVANTGLSYHLQTEVKNIVYGEPADKGISGTEMPAVFVEFTDIKEEIASMGAGAHRRADFTINLYPVTNVGMASFDSSVTSIKEMQQLTQNCLDLIRLKPSLSITGLWYSGVETEFDTPRPDSTTFVRTSHIKINCSYLVT
jgi:hypothetical protein